MRILQLIDSLDAGGAERMAINYANMLSQEHLSFICVTRTEGLLKKAMNNNVDYLFLNKKKTLDFKSIKRLNNYVKKHNIEIVHAHATSFFIATLIKFFNRKIKLIWHDHYGNSEFLKYRKFKILKLCSYKFNTIVSVNDVLKTWSENNLKCKKVSVLNNFVTISTNEVKETVLKGQKGKRIVCLANLRQQKNHLMLLDAFRGVYEYDKEWTLHIVGEDKADSYSSTLKEKIGALKLHNNVFIYGSRSDVQNILSQSDMGVLSSKSEGLPLALLEYGLAKLPVVATNVGDCNKVVTKISEGVLVESGNYTAFGEAMLNYINNKDLRTSCGETLFENVTNNFSHQSIKKQLIEIYSS
ncbi:glycosyltransferase [Sabulilitoribacter arenilitoris]|uniref:Glycosyltransferase n=1 Tax=Wocania arenilitoris TaxID=2044858 RepID=A0AAE3JQ91_9FLAO|nr:glycosyltransferase [Wocania arenilitoris]MCF7568975.1 glycosyltransferase [Wocania arenilitoris]